MGSWLWRPNPPAITVSVPTPSPSPLALITVQLVGEVSSPGVYTLASGSRVQDAINQAGGLTADGDPSSLNLAARMSDGQRLNVASRQEARTTTAPGKVNLNRASRADLEALPGIGPTTAQRILELRERDGPIRSLDQLRELRIINVQTAEHLRELVTLE